MRSTVSTTVNGRSYESSVEHRLTLADFLRHEIGLKGTHVGCELGACGACTVIVNGELALSCLMLAHQVHGAEVQTVEGLKNKDGTMHPLQRAFGEHHALQCGFCTPGILLSMIHFLGENAHPNEEEIRDALGGNLCRCTGYHNIVKAVLQFSEHKAFG